VPDEPEPVIAAENSKLSRPACQLWFSALTPILMILARYSGEFEIKHDGTGKLIAKILQPARAVRCDLNAQGIRFKQPL
jgi:hypothetical protein